MVWCTNCCYHDKTGLHTLWGKQRQQTHLGTIRKSKSNFLFFLHPPCSWSWSLYQERLWGKKKERQKWNITPNASSSSPSLGSGNTVGLDGEETQWNQREVTSASQLGTIVCPVLFKDLAKFQRPGEEEKERKRGEGRGYLLFSIAIFKIPMMLSAEDTYSKCKGIKVNIYNSKTVDWISNCIAQICTEHPS